MFVLCYSKVSHATLNFLYHTPMLTLHNSLTIKCIWIATSVILQSLECSYEDPFFELGGVIS